MEPGRFKLLAQRQWFSNNALKQFVRVFRAYVPIAVMPPHIVRIPPFLASVAMIEINYGRDGIGYGVGLLVFLGHLM